MFHETADGESGLEQQCGPEEFPRGAQGVLAHGAEQARFGHPAFSDQTRYGIDLAALDRMGASPREPDFFLACH